MKTGINIGNRPGPTPGSDMEVRQHKAMAMGKNVVGKPERCVETFQRRGSTGETHVPGLTSANVKKRM